MRSRLLNLPLAGECVSYKAASFSFLFFWFHKMKYEKLLKIAKKSRGFQNYTDLPWACIRLWKSPPLKYNMRRVASFTFIDPAKLKRNKTTWLIYPTRKCKYMHEKQKQQWKNPKQTKKVPKVYLFKCGKLSWFK